MLHSTGVRMPFLFLYAIFSVKFLDFSEVQRDLYARLISSFASMGGVLSFVFRYL